MIVSDKLKYVYVAVPKTASAATREFLKKYYYGRNINRYHSVDVPEQCRQYFKFTVVRDPYERAFSRWFFERYPNKNYREPRVPWGIGFYDFMEWLIDNKYNDPMPNSLPHINMTQTEFYKQSNCNSYVRLESFEKDFSCLPFVERGDALNLPVVRVTQHKPKASFYGYFRNEIDSAKEAVNAYCGPEDFINFGYEM